MNDSLNHVSLVKRSLRLETVQNDPEHSNDPEHPTTHTLT